jgi:PAS domain S-box-containing protein
MAVRLRVILAVFLMTAAVVVVSAFALLWLGNRVLEAHAREELRREGVARLNELGSVLKDAETGQRGFIITGDENYLAPFNEASERLPSKIQRLRSFQWIDVGPTEIDKIAGLIDQKMAELRKTIELRRTGGLNAAVPIIQEGSGKRVMDELREVIGDLHAREMAAVRTDASWSDATTRARTVGFILICALNVGMLAWAYFRISEAVKSRDAALRESHRRGFELQQQKDLLDVTLSSIGDCVIVTNEKGRITFMNRVAEEVTGWKANEAIGRPTSEVFKIVNEKTRQVVENPVEKVMKLGVIVGLANHTLLIRKDGSEIPIDDSGAPIRDVNGELRGVVLVFRDFSEHKAAERELQQAKEEAENANKAKDQFLAMLSHELRTPLTPVLATLNLWETSEEVPPSLLVDIQMLRRSVELEARIIDDLLDLTRIARGLLSFSPETTDVHSLIEFLIGLSQSDFQDKALDLSPNFKADRHNIYTDAGRLQQILWNIIRNAIKFTPRGGQITISTSNDAENNIQIAIADNGIGMTPDTISKLFQPFEQADPAQNRRYGGLGLGMAISSALVDLLEGDLRAESGGPGRGSTFTLTFPTSEARAEPIEAQPINAQDRGRYRLLLVEDHLDTARTITKLLERRGYKLETAGTVAEALDAVDRGNFDLLICDLGLPDGSGIELVEKIRKTRKTPAIALTGFGMQEDIERAKRAGFDAHLTKPANLQKLEATMWRLLQERR